MPFGVKVQPWADAVAKISAKTPIGSRLRSYEWDRMPISLREAGMFSARVESARLLSDMQQFLIDSLNGNSTEGGAIKDRGRFISDMRKLAQQLGVGQLGKSEITDIQGPTRLGLICDMQASMARGYARWKTGHDQDMLNEWPAQQLIRISSRKEPRDWQERWNQAAENAGFVGVASAGMIALKDSPIWKHLSRFGTPWPPFDYGSGMGVEDVDRDKAEALGLILPGQIIEPTGEQDFAASMESSAARITKDLQHVLEQSGLVIAGGKVRYMPSTVIEHGIRTDSPLFKPVNDLRKALAVTEVVTSPSGAKVVFDHGITKHWVEKSKSTRDLIGRRDLADVAVDAVRKPDVEGFDQNGKRVFLKFSGNKTVKVIVGHDGAVETWIPTSMMKQREKWVGQIRRE